MNATISEWKQHQQHCTYYKNKFTELTLEQIIEEIGDNIHFDMFTAIQNGKEIKCREPRGTVWYSDAGHTFNYAGKVMKSIGMMPNILSNLRDQIEKICGTRYCSVLINYYPNGKSGMRYHSDPLYSVDGIQIWHDDSCVISIGASRKFVFRDANTKTPKYYRYTLSNGDMIHMFNQCQQRYQHCVKVKKDVDLVGARISLVFKKRY